MMMVRGNAVSRAFSATSQSLKRGRSTLNSVEAEKFRQVDWDGAQGSGAALAAMHETRMSAIETYLDERSLLNGPNKDLQGIRVLDVGCGGGLLSTSLVKLNADVVAIDAVGENVEYTRKRCETAVQQQSSSSGSFDGRHCTVEELLSSEGSGAFDVVISLEVIEHVNQQDVFLDSLCRLSSNAMALSTINRTFKSYALAIVGAEYVTGMVPPGTHDWFKFVQPEQIERSLQRNSLSCDKTIGMIYNPITGHWHQSNSELDVNYILFASH